MTNTATTDHVSLDSLADQYEVIGELGGRPALRAFLARRRDAGDDVLVSVFRPVAGDDGNALGHLASDANRLAQHAHPNLVGVHEARWLANDALAVVTDRVRHPTLEDLLIRRDEAFSCPRVAMLLRDINAALEWARAEKIVHRHVEPSSIHVEPGSDRVQLSFVLRPLPLADMPGPDDDARTIASLARAMLTRSVADPERDSLPLNELRPGLPERLVEQTEALLRLSPNDPVPDVSEYIAIIAMSDALKRVETECAETTRKLLEEERLAREKIEAERQATERAAAEQARLFQLEREEFGQERERILAELQKQREALERERTALARERAEHAQDREVLIREREEHRRWADEVEKAFAAQAAALAQQTRLVEERIAEERAAIERSVEERVAQELAARMPATTPDGQRGVAPQPVPPKKQRKPKEEPLLAALTLPARPKTHRVTPDWVRKLSHTWSDLWARRPKWQRRMKWNRHWNVPAAIVAVVLLVAVSAVAIARGRDGEESVVRSANANGDRTVDSAAGRVAAPVATARDTSGLPADFVASVRRTREAGVPADLVTGVRARSDSGAQPLDVSVPRVREGQSTQRPTPRGIVRQPVRQPATTPAQAPAANVDTFFGLPSPFIPGAPAPVAPTRDTIRRDPASPRPDSVIRRDSVIRDTSARGDTSTARPTD